MNRGLQVLLLSLLSLLSVGCPMISLRPAADPPAGTPDLTKRGNWVAQNSTPGARLVMTELTRTNRQGGTDIEYGVKTVGLPNTVAFVLRSWPLTTDQPNLIGKYRPDDSGRLLAVDSGKPLPAILLNGFTRGEPFAMCLESEDRSIMAYGKVIPFPIEAQGEGGCRVEVERLDRVGKEFRISLQGFEPNETVTQTSVSAGESMKSNVNMGKGGDYDLLMLPSVVGRQAGTNALTFAGSRCRVAVEYAWGTAASKAE